ncbi:hypothetical protein MNBD_GAMMA15-892 [hydrothermal vent metagenome]|uniref:Lipoprotein n=1 Tax=hydrothermal vent metagenome TaxID=652676 RepID=A0A3B0YJZ8_9ZZZZ
MKPCWVSYLLWLIISIAGVSAMLSSCGQKGGLYLPDKTEQADDSQK